MGAMDQDFDIVVITGAGKAFSAGGGNPRSGRHAAERSLRQHSNGTYRSGSKRSAR